MPVCHIRDTDQPHTEAFLGRVEFSVLPRTRDLVSFSLPGAGRKLYEVVAVEHLGVHESTDRSVTPASAPGIPLPATEPSVVLHIRTVDADPGLGP